MPGETRKPVTIYYKRLADDIPGFVGLDLEDAIRRALDCPAPDGGRIRDLWRHRCRTDPRDQREHLFINHQQDDETLLFGDLVCFTQGRAQALLNGLGDVEEVDILQFDPPAQQEFLNSMMFWMLKDNHAFLIQSAGLRSEALERYFSWLLCERTTVVPTGTHVMLVDELDIDVNGRGAGSDIKSLSIGGRVSAFDSENGADTRPTRAPTERVERRDMAEVGDRGDENWAVRVLTAVLGDHERVDAALRRLPDDARLRVSVKLGYERPKRDLDRSALQDVLVMARNLPDSDLTADTKSGKIHGDKIRLTHPARVLANGDLLDRNDVKRAMVEAYRTFVDNGKIEP